MASTPITPNQGSPAQGPAPTNGVTPLIAQIALQVKQLSQMVPQAAQQIQTITQSLIQVHALAMGGQPAPETPAPPM